MMGRGGDGMGWGEMGLDWTGDGCRLATRRRGCKGDYVVGGEKG